MCHICLQLNFKSNIWQHFIVTDENIVEERVQVEEQMQAEEEMQVEEQDAEDQHESDDDVQNNGEDDVRTENPQSSMYYTVIE